jgi:hypothetical protein
VATWQINLGIIQRKSRICPQGTLDPYSNEKFPLIFKASEYSVFIDELEPIKFINNDFYLIEKEKDWYFQ